MGLKACGNFIYRDNFQAFATIFPQRGRKKDDKKTEEAATAALGAVAAGPARNFFPRAQAAPRRCRPKRASVTHKFSIGGT